MAKLTYDEIMKKAREGITPELIEEVIEEMGINKYPGEDAQRMHLENALHSVVNDWIEKAIDSMTLSELEERVEYFKRNQNDISEIRIGRPEIEEEDIKISAKDLWL